MPHCVLEYSANVQEQVDFTGFFSKLHEMLTASGDIALDNLKSRWHRREDFFMGDGNPRNAFVYLQISMMTGRPEKLRQEFGQRALEMLQGLYAKSSKQLNLSITVEVREMDRNTHFKNSR